MNNSQLLQLLVNLLKPHSNIHAILSASNQSNKKYQELLQSLLQQQKYDLLKRIIRAHPELVKLIQVKTQSQNNKQQQIQLQSYQKKQDKRLNFFMNEVFTIRRPTLIQYQYLTNINNNINIINNITSKKSDYNNTNMLQQLKPKQQQQQSNTSQTHKQFNKLNLILSCYENKRQEKPLKEQIHHENSLLTFFIKQPSSSINKENIDNVFNIWIKFISNNNDNNNSSNKYQQSSIISTKSSNHHPLLHEQQQVGYQLLIGSFFNSFSYKFCKCLLQIIQQINEQKGTQIDDKNILMFSKFLVLEFLTIQQKYLLYSSASSSGGGKSLITLFKLFIENSYLLLFKQKDQFSHSSSFVKYSSIISVVQDITQRIICLTKQKKQYLNLKDVIQYFSQQRLLESLIVTSFQDTYNKNNNNKQNNKNILLMMIQNMFSLIRVSLAQKLFLIVSMNSTHEQQQQEDHQVIHISNNLLYEYVVSNILQRAKQGLKQLKSNLYLSQNGRYNSLTALINAQSYVFKQEFNKIHMVYQQHHKLSQKNKLLTNLLIERLACPNKKTNDSQTSLSLKKLKSNLTEFLQFLSKQNNLLSAQQIQKLKINQFSIFSEKIQQNKFNFLFCGNPLISNSNEKLSIIGSEYKNERKDKTKSSTTKLFLNQKYSKSLIPIKNIIQQHYFYQTLTKEQQQQQQQQKLSSTISLTQKILSYLILESNTIISEFQFLSPTFNQQYLTFNYIYNSPQQIYLYQNHHQNHILLEIYFVLINHQIDKNIRQIKNNTNNTSNTNITITTKQKPSSTQILTKIFQKLRNFIGQYMKQKLLLINSKQFYSYVNIFKCLYITFTDRFFTLIGFNEICMLFMLLLEVIQRQNHPLLRQYIDVLLARVYFFICAKDESKHQEYKKILIEMLDLNLKDMNVNIPIIFILGYELLQSYNQQQSKQGKYKESKTKTITTQISQQAIINNNITQKDNNNDDIHYILIKYISCHVAYIRTICQYYLSKYLEKKHSKNDQFLNNLYKFWREDKDSLKIMANISIAVEGFRKELQKKNNEELDFYLVFERVEQYPNQMIRYFLNKDTVLVLNKLSRSIHPFEDYQLKNKICQRVQVIKRQNIAYVQTLLAQDAVKENKVANDKKGGKSKGNNSSKTKSSKAEKIMTQEEQSAQIQDQHLQLSKKQVLYNKLNQQYQEAQLTQRPKVIIIATLLQKVHNFGYLMRTLTKKNAMLIVPSKQPLLHPQCQQLCPPLWQVDVQVVEIKPKDLQSFIKMQKLRGYPLIALEQCSQSVQLEQTQFPEYHMLLLGNQRIGAASNLLNMADILVEIPQVGKIRSLNVHVSMVICFWQYLRQQQHQYAKKKQIK